MPSLKHVCWSSFDQSCGEEDGQEGQSKQEGETLAWASLEAHTVEGLRI